MNRPEFVYVTYIISTPQKVWDALTRGAFTKIYWGDRRIESTWAVGSPVRFFDGDSDHVTDSGVVLDCDPPRRLAYTFAPEYEELTRHGVPDAQARAISARPSRVTFTLNRTEEWSSSGSFTMNCPMSRRHAISGRDGRRSSPL